MKLQTWSYLRFVIGAIAFAGGVLTFVYLGGLYSAQESQFHSSTAQQVPFSPTPLPLNSPLTALEVKRSRKIFQLAIDNASSAAKLTQSAISADDWNLVAWQWQRAVELLEKVPAAAEQWSLAQQKIPEYHRNLDYAKEQELKQKIPNYINPNQFIQKGLAYATKLYGEPKIKPKKVYLRFAYHINQFGGTAQLLDEQRGIFVIRIEHSLPNQFFYKVLAHEVGHLLNARVLDCYMEGLSDVFAEQLLRDQGFNPEIVENSRRRDPFSFYGGSYLMMKELVETVGEQPMRSFLKFAVYENVQASPKMFINIEAWLASLPPEVAQKGRRVILKHIGRVSKKRDSLRGYQFACMQPKP